MNRRRKAAPAAKSKAVRRPPRLGLRERAEHARARGRALWERVRRPAILAGKGLLIVATVAGAVAVARLVEIHVRTSPAFAIRDLQVEGQERMLDSEVLRVAGLAEGQNVFDVAPEDARARLERHPWVASAEVRRRLPGTYQVSIVERHAVAILSLGGLYLVADDGTVFKQLENEDPADLPVVTGIDRARFTGDRAYRTSVLLEVVALMHDYRGAGLWRREPIAEIHVEADDAVTLYTGDDGMQVRLGRGPFRTKLRKLRRVLDRLEDREARPAYVYVDNVRRPDRVTVRLR